VAPGIRLPQPTPAFHYIHKETPEGNLYFLRSGNPTSLKVDVGFPHAGTQPIYLDLWAGEEHPAIQYREEAGLLKVPLTFPPYGSHAVFFPIIGGMRLENSVVTADLPEPLALTSWHLTVQHRLMSGEIEPIDIDLPKLKDWREVKHLRYCAGPGTYSTKFELLPKHLAPDVRLLLRLGKVHDVAVVHVNGQEMPPLLIPPYEMDISAYAREGNNSLEVVVTGTLRNLLVGYGKAGGRAWRHQKGRDLMPVGLIGPIIIQFQRILTSIDNQ
jgi:hypothetical protein